MGSSDRPTAPPLSGSRTTMVQCLACDGRFSSEERSSEPGRFAFVICRWCTAGYMSPEQAIRWSRHVRELLKSRRSTDR